MDSASQNDAQQLPYQQLHQQYREYELQQQQLQQQQQQHQPQQQTQGTHQQQQVYAAQAVDPYNHQTYDPSNYYAYYQYPQQQQQQNQSQQQSSYSYYQHNYGGTFQQQSQPESVAVQPSGIPFSHDMAVAAVNNTASAVPAQHTQNVYQPNGTIEQQNPGYPVPQGLNPAAAAAVAALSQLSQFAGNMDAAERAMAVGYQEHHLQGRSGYYGHGAAQFPGNMMMHHAPGNFAPQR